MSQVALTFLVDVADITVGRAADGREYVNLPYRMVGTLGNLEAKLTFRGKGGGYNLTIPTSKDQAKVAKPKLIDPKVLKAITG